MNNRKLVSIITVCYNSEKTIERTINSVLNQTYSNIEYIIVDGESTDNTLNIIKKYEPLFNGKMKFISEPDNGIYDAMNKGILLSKGDLVGIVNSDDYYELDAVENIVNNMINDKYQVLYGLMRMVKDEKELRVIMNSHNFLSETMIEHPTCFVSKKIYDELEMYDINYKSCADYKFMLDIYKNKNVKFIPVYKIISNFSIGGISASNLASNEVLELKKQYGLISKKNYIKNKIKLILKKIIK